jgi:rod shape-determining protein MreD
MRPVAAFLFVLLGLTLQSTLLSYFAPFRPDLGIIVALYLGLSQPFKRGALLAFLVGYAEDLFMGDPVGLRATGLVLLFLAARPMHEKIQIDGIGTLLTLGFFSSLFVSLIDTLLRRLFVTEFDLNGGYLSGAVLGAVATAVAAPLVSRLLLVLIKSGPRKEDSLLGR